MHEELSWLLPRMGILLATIAAAFVLFSASLATEGQEAGKIYRIGVLLGDSRPDTVGASEAFQQGLRDLGYVEGRNLSIEYRFAEGRLDRFPQLAAQLVRARVDVIFSPGTAAAQAAMKSTATIPIVIATAGNRIGDRLIGSFARPGGNVTGLTMVAGPELGGKYLQLLKEAAPGVSRVAVLWNPLTAPHTVLLKEMGTAARALGLEIQPVSARQPEQVEGAFAARWWSRCGRGVHALFGGYEAGIARGLQARHDHGSQYVSDYFQAELKFPGIGPVPGSCGSWRATGWPSGSSGRSRSNCCGCGRSTPLEDLRQATPRVQGPVQSGVAL